MQNLNTTLEIINGSVAILSFLLIFFLLSYLISDIQREGFSARNFLIKSTAISLVVALLVEKSGTFMTRTIVWAWRTRGGTLPFTTVEGFFLISGAVFTAFGLIMMIRVLSRPQLGDWPWMTSATVSLLYVAMEVIVHLMR
jgi:hypothetical protein